MRVLVTGSAGFIGSRIVNRLAAADDVEVLAGRRSSAPNSSDAVRTVQADVTDATALARAMEGVDAVVHAAVGDRTVTADGTRAVLTAAEQQGVSRVVHLSSIAVYGAATGRVTEATPFAEKPSGYSEWKIDAEQAAMASPLSVARLRPTIVYGRGGEQWTEKALRRLRSGRWGTLGTLGEGTCNPVHVDDVAAAVEAALRSQATGAFNVNGPESLSWNDWFRRMAAAAGLGPLPSTPVRTARGRILAAAPAKVVRKAKPSFDPPSLRDAPGLGEMRAYSLRATYPTDAAQAALGWAPSIDVAAGLTEALTVLD